MALRKTKKVKKVSFNSIIVLGHFINPISDKKAVFYPNGAMLLTRTKSSPKYKIKKIGHQKQILKLKNEQTDILDYSDHIIVPSFFDMHFHWVQDAVRKMPKDNLLKWLEKYTFPAEAKFQNKKYAKKEAAIFFKRLIATGTLGGACYSSIHDHALEYAMEEAKGDFIIGNVLMTMNSPKNLTQSKKEAIQSVKKLSGKYKEKYALTPRFAIATDPETMSETSKIAKKNKSFMQSHLSETKNEIHFVKSLYKDLPGFKKGKSYTEIYKKVGMLGPKCIMGHGIHLEPEELNILAKTKTSIAHCPTSNAPHRELGLGSGLFDFKKSEKNGVRWALASDIGGGPYVSMLDVMRSFVEQNKKAGVSGADYKKALFRSTLAGAEILKLDKKKGNFELGKEANFVVLPKLKLSKADDVNSILAKIIKIPKRRTQLDSLPVAVYYQGKCLFSQ